MSAANEKVRRIVFSILKEIKPTLSPFEQEALAGYIPTLSQRIRQLDDATTERILDIIRNEVNE